MRLVVWNCRQALSVKLEPLLSLRPDVAIVPESAGPDAGSTKGVLAAPGLTSAPWVGKNKHKGLGVFTFGEYRVLASAPGPVASDYSLHASISGPLALDLVAVWSQAPGYIENVHAAVEAFAGVLRSGRAVLAGDLNSNATFDRLHKPNHSDLIARLKSEFGLVSAYHSVSREEQGAETQPTHRHVTRGTLWHLDYVFVPETWASGVRVEVGDRDVWAKWSDHFPVVVDIPSATIQV